MTTTLTTLAALSLALAAVSLSLAHRARSRSKRLAKAVDSLMDNYTAIVSHALADKTYQLRESNREIAVVSETEDAIVVAWRKAIAEETDRDYVRLCAEEVCNHLNEEI